MPCPKYVSEQAIWLDGLCSWQLALTANLKRHDTFGRPFNEQVVISTAYFFANALSRVAFGREKCRQGYSVGIVFAYGFGAYCDKPHIHASLCFPTVVLPEHRIELINKAAGVTRWTDGQPYIKSYRDWGWQSYMANHGMDRVLVDLIRLPNPT